MGDAPKIQPRLPAKFLGSLNMPDACRRCFAREWALNQMPAVRGRKVPFRFPLPGVFIAIDSLAKANVRSHLDRTGRLPDWFPKTEFTTKVTGYLDPGKLHFRRFRADDPDTGLTVSASPDEVLETPDGCVVVDYKTARFTAAQDALLPLYEAQLNTELFIAERAGLFEVAELGLCYAEPGTWDGGSALDLPLQPSWHPVGLDRGLAPRLLREAKAVMDGANGGGLPEGREGCPDCLLLGRVRALEGR